MIEVDNDFLIRMDSEAMVMLMNNGKNLSKLSYLEFRKHMFKKYYKGEKEETSYLKKGNHSQEKPGKETAAKELGNDVNSSIPDTNNQQIKKDGKALSVSHLETRSSMEEDNTRECKAKDVDNQSVDILKNKKGWGRSY